MTADSSKHRTHTQKKKEYRLHEVVGLVKVMIGRNNKSIQFLFCCEYNKMDVVALPLCYAELIFS